MTSTLLAQQMREDFVKRAHEKSQELFDALQASALGHFIQVKTASGEVKVYKTKPDVAALKEINDRVHGKAHQSIELSEAPDIQIDL